MCPFRETFGGQADAAGPPCDRLARPRGPVSIWLPSNVSLLGPLTLVLLSLTGNPLRMKVSLRGNDLTEAFLDFVRARPARAAGRLCLQQGDSGAVRS